MSGVYCGKCKNKYATRQNWANHFTVSKVNSQTPGITTRQANVCFNTKDARVYDSSLDKAVKNFEDLMKQRKASNIYFAADKPGLSDKPLIPYRSLSPSKGQTFVPKKRKLQYDEENDGKEDPKKDNVKSNCEEEKSKIPKPNEQKGSPEGSYSITHDEISEKLSELLKKASINNQLIKEIQTEIKQKSHDDGKSKTRIPVPVKPKKQGINMLDKENEDSFNKDLNLLRASRSMNEVLNNALIKTAFTLIEGDIKESETELNLPKFIENVIADEDVLITETNTETLDEQHTQDDHMEVHESKFTLMCKACSHTNFNVKFKGLKVAAFAIKDPLYSCPKDKLQERWFINLKGNLKKHIAKLQHHQRVASYEVINNYNLNSQKQVQKICSNILYYMVKTNSPASMYPIILAVIFRSGYQVGNLNHSFYTYTKLLNYIDLQIKLDSKKWFDKQDSVSITADIGTVRGISLLVVLLMSEVDDRTVFVGMNPVSSKAGAYCADEIVNILTSKKYLELDLSELKKKISGVVCDGAFTKENKPFKNKMKEHLGDLTFRWDPLHMANRAHISAMELQDANFNLNTVMDYIQNHSKRFRSGLEYTKLQLDQMFGFKRPKLKSETRLVNYDFDQVLRFLENQIWFDLPVDMVYVSKMYVLVAYVTKIILAIAQKNDVKTEYIKSVFYNQKGKEAMVQAIDMGYEIISNKSTCDVVQENRPESNIDGKFEDVKDYLINELCNLA